MASSKLSIFLYSAISCILRIMIALQIHVPIRWLVEGLHLIRKIRYRTDDRIRQAVVKRLERLDGLKRETLSVKVKSGVVSLRGGASSYEVVVRAGLLAARRIPTVAGVVNDLTSPEEREEALTPVQVSQEPLTEVDEAEVVIVGGGIIGCSIFRELTRYDLGVLLVEKECDLGCGASKANNGMVHPGLTPKYGSNRHRLNIRGNELYEKLCNDLDVPFERCGTLAISMKPSQLPLRELGYLKGRVNGLRGDQVAILDRKKLLGLEPNLSPNALGALWMKSAGITSPFSLTIACAENGLENGGRILLGTRVTGIDVEGGKISGVMTDRGRIRCRVIVNAAGIYSDKVAEMAGAREFSIHPRAGALLVFDKSHGDFVKHVIASLAMEKDAASKGGGITLSIDGNHLWGPDAVEVREREKTTVSSDQIQRIIDKFNPLLRDFPVRDVISYFTGLRAATFTEDFIIRPAKNIGGMIFACGIQSPGLAAAPAIAEEVVSMVRDRLGSVKEKKDFNPKRKGPGIVKNLPEKSRDSLIRNNPEYGHIVCRCEEVSEGEVMAAIHGTVPATTLDGLKRRLRCGMGRCQGGFCTPHLANILSRELKMPLENVTKDGPGSELFTGRTKAGS